MNRHRTYSPPLPQIPADPLCGNPCDTRDPRICVQPLKGQREPRAASVSYRALVPAGHAGCGDALSYRALAPAGAGTWCRTCAGTSGVPQPTAHSSLLTVHSSFASGWQTFSYGKLGELTENIRTFALPFESKTYSFKMQYEYDSWNRIQKMTYPDGEEVHYDYNLGGMLEKVYGQYKRSNMEPQIPIPHDSLIVRPMQMNTMGLNVSPGDIGPFPLYTIYTYPYIDSIVYNEFEQRSEVFHGNGTHTLYVYDSLRRLLLLQSQTHAGDIMQDILYTYDSVSNITGIANSAGMLPNGLGGTYNSAYTYDDLYRLTSSTGGWQGSQNISYRTTTLYRGNGRIKQKNLAARKLLNGVSDSVNYSHYYHYENTSQPNTLTRYSSSVWNPGSWLGLSNEDDSHFGWNSAGNMTESCIGGTQNCRDFCWDEQNRLQGVKDNKWLSYYQYDAAGDRTYKLTGKGELQNINGEWRYFYHLDNATLYVSPYLVATKQGYTKHYYAETERIASRIGGGRLRYLDQPVVGQGKIVEKQSTNKTYAKEVLEECLDAIHSEGQADLHHLYDMINSAHSETDCYWYHPDHLGSSSWITDSAGTAVQHLHYLPWGEDFVDQRLNSFDGVRYTFSAKEKDSETGLSYFGSRYYSSDLSIWLSVDPMAAKYPHQSNYVYCSNNPIKVVDPNGEDEWEVNKSGHIRHVDGSEGTPDKLFVVRGFGKKRFKERIDGEGLKVDAELMKGLCDSEGDGKIVFSKTHSDDKLKKMEEMFNFLADNTNVEWALATVDVATGYGLTLERTDFLITDHHRIRCETATALTVNCSRNGGLIRMKHSHPAYYSLMHLLDDSSISKPSGNPYGTDYKKDYGHKRLCTKPENSPNAIFILRHRGHERTY